MSSPSSHNLNQTPSDDLGLDEDLAALWTALQDGVKKDLFGEEQAARLSVLRALDAAGYGDALTADEQAFLAASGPSSGHPRAMTTRISDDIALFEQVWEAQLDVQRPARRSRRRSLVRWPARIALGVSALVLVAIGVFSVLDEARRTTVTASTGTEVIQLADGSTARLAPGATLTYVAGTSFDRSVNLTGSAYFEVAPRSTGFSVRTSTASTTVLGTRFGVTGSETQTAVVLIAGRVAVTGRSGKDAVVVLDPGQLTTVRAGQDPSPPENVILAEALPWSDLLIFRDTPMHQVVERLRETRGASITLAPELAELGVTGTFGPEQSTTEILQILSATLGATLDNAAGEFRIVPANERPL